MFCDICEFFSSISLISLHGSEVLLLTCLSSTAVAEGNVSPFIPPWSLKVTSIVVASFMLLFIMDSSALRLLPCVVSLCWLVGVNVLSL